MILNMNLLHINPVNAKSSCNGYR